MVSSPKADVESSILIWARETSGLDLTTVAKRVGTTVEKIEQWEQEESDLRPTIKQLRKLAKMYMRPIGMFFLPALPEDPEGIKDFRRIPSEFSADMSSALRFEIRLAWERRDEALELTSDLDEEPATIENRFSLADDPDSVAGEIRSLLGISIREQMRWSNKYEAFSSWREVVEERGTLVFQTGVLRNLMVLPKEARGFSIAAQPYPVIVVNSKDHSSARCFTLIHELAHILLDDGGLCDLHNPFRAASQIDQTEMFCNRVAGTALVPSQALLETDVVRSHGRSHEWSDDELDRLSRTFWVSWEVILRRLLILERTSRDFYQRWREERADIFPGTDIGTDNERAAMIPTATRVVIKNGKLFPKLVLRALAGRKITSFEASDILGAAPTRLRDVEAAVF